MSSIRRPVGPERPGVYWRRRALVLGVVLLVVVVVVLIVVGRGNGAPGAGPSVVPTASPSGAGSGAAPAARPTSSAPSPSAPARKDGAACAEDQITLTPVVDQDVYAATDDPQIAMTIENTGSNSCHMDLGSAQQELVITSGTEQYWSS
jgi:hypothetical protein